MRSGSLSSLSIPRQHLFLFCLCAAAYTCAYMGRLNYSACLVQIIADCGLTRAQGGMIGTAFFVVYGCGQLLNGFVGDRAAPHRMILLGLLGSGLSNLAFALAHSAGVLTALWCCNGFFQSLLWSPIIRIFAEWFRPEYRRAACIRINLIVPAGTVAAYLLAVLFIRLGNWRGQFLLVGALLVLLSGVWAACLAPLSRSSAFVPAAGAAAKPAAPARPSVRGPSLWPLRRRAGLFIFFFPLAAQGILKDGVTTWVPSFTAEAYGLTPALSVFGTMFLPLVNLGGVYLASWLDRRVFKNELASTGALFLLNTGFIALLYLARGAGPWPAYLLLALATTTMMGANTLFASSMPLAFAPWGRSSSAAGVLNFCIYVGCSVSIWGTGFASAALGWGSTILGWAGRSLAGGLFCAAAARRWQRFKQT